MKLNITKVFRDQKTSKAGKPYTSLRIQATQYGQKWISGFGNKANESWKEGDEVEVNIVPNGEYLNFEMPKVEKTQVNDEALKGIKYIVLKTETLEKKLDVIIAHLSGRDRLDRTSAGTKVPNFSEVNDPFVGMAEADESLNPSSLNYGI